MRHFKFPRSVVRQPMARHFNIYMSKETRGTARIPVLAHVIPAPQLSAGGCPPPGCRLKLVSSSKFSVSCCLFFFFLHSRSNGQRFAIRSRRYNLHTNSCTSFKLPANGIPKDYRHLRYDPTRSGQRRNIGICCLWTFVSPGSCDISPFTANPGENPTPLALF